MTKQNRIDEQERIIAKHERIVSGLLTALGAIRREAHERASEGSLDFIYGLATQAEINCTSQLERNSDGYLVKVKL